MRLERGLTRVHSLNNVNRALQILQKNNVSTTSLGRGAPLYPVVSMLQTEWYYTLIHISGRMKTSNADSKTFQFKNICIVVLSLLKIQLPFFIVLSFNLTLVLYRVSLSSI